MIEERLRPVNRYTTLAIELNVDVTRAPDGFFDSGGAILETHRFGQWAAALPSSPLRLIAAKIHAGASILVEMATGNKCCRQVKIGFRLDLRGVHNVQIQPGVEIGDDCRVASNVTIGPAPRWPPANGARAATAARGAPRVGNRVVIESGAQILGPIAVGDGAIIRANSLVVTDVPAGATVVGVPARVMLPAPVPVEARGRDMAAAPGPGAAARR